MYVEVELFFSESHHTNCDHPCHNHNYHCHIDNSLAKSTQRDGFADHMYWALFAGGHLIQVITEMASTVNVK